MENKILGPNGRPAMPQRNNQADDRTRVRGFKTLGKNELSKRLVKATKMLDNWMQGVIELGGKLLAVYPEDAFFDNVSDSSQSTLKMMSQRCREVIVQSNIATITYTFTDGREPMVVNQGEMREAILAEIKEKTNMEKCSICDGEKTVKGNTEVREVCPKCHGLGMTEVEEAND